MELTTHEEKMILVSLYDVCDICNDYREFCSLSKGERLRGSWREGDGIHTLREKLGMKPYVGRHRLGRHAA